jgi:hypothetical protein
MQRSYYEFLYRARSRHGAQFSEADLDTRFVPFFESGARIKILDLGSEEVTGTVGVTTGWKPAFLLMRRANSMGSEILLGPKTKILAVQRNGRYVPYPGS